MESNNPRIPLDVVNDIETKHIKPLLAKFTTLTTEELCELKGRMKIMEALHREANRGVDITFGLGIKTDVLRKTSRTRNRNSSSSASGSDST
jgi:hypothetical protein